MKNFRNLKQGVFTIGFISLLLGMFVAFAGLGPMSAFFPMYAGLLLMATVLLHKEENRAIV